MNLHLAPNPLSIRVAALFTSAAMTTVIFGSQLDLAEHYISTSDDVLAAERTVPIVEKADCAIPLRPRA